MTDRPNLDPLQPSVKKAYFYFTFDDGSTLAYDFGSADSLEVDQVWTEPEYFGYVPEIVIVKDKPITKAFKFNLNWPHPNADGVVYTIRKGHVDD